MIVDNILDARLEDLRERLRQLEEGIRTLQARLAAWDRIERPRPVEPSRESVVPPLAAIAVEP